MMDAGRRTSVRDAIVLGIALGGAIGLGFAISVAVAITCGLLRPDRFPFERHEAPVVAAAIR
jgi:hypothetical protein